MPELGCDSLVVLSDHVVSLLARFGCLCRIVSHLDIRFEFFNLSNKLCLLICFGTDFLERLVKEQDLLV